MARSARSATFIAPRVCGAEPAKSTTNRSPSTVTVARIGTGSPPTPSSSRKAVKLALPAGMPRMRLRSRRAV